MRLEIDVTYRIGARALRSKLATNSDRIAVVGPSGIGKTTLLRVILGLVPSSGPLKLDGVALDALPPEARGIGWAPQDAALFPHLDVHENLGFASVEKSLERIAEVVGVTRLLSARASTLSGGERQRVALGRAIARAPRLYVLDEPLSALDRDARRAVAAAVEVERSRTGAALILASHDELDVSALADEVYGMREDGTLTPWSG